MALGAAGGAAGNIAGQAYDNATGAANGFSTKGLVQDTLMGGATGGLLHLAGPWLRKIFCFDGDTLVQVAPQPAQPYQVAMAGSGAVNNKTGRAAGKGKSLKAVPAPKAVVTTKRIKDLHDGDLVASRNPRTGKTEYKRVLHVFHHNAAEMVAVSIAEKASGKIVEVVKATPEHPFFTTHGLVSAGQLGIGTELVTRAGPQNGPTLVVAKVEKVAVEAGGHPVYNIEVADDHTYFVCGVAGGIWVHNTCPSKKLSDWLKDSPELLEECREWFQNRPNWWGIDPDSTMVKYVPKDTVDEIRALAGESGGHHPHGLALGGPRGQNLTLTGETRTVKNPIHSQVTGLQKRVINQIKSQL